MTTTPQTRDFRFRGLPPGARLAGGAVTVLALLGLVRVSHVAIPMHAGSGALLRVAWGARPERLEVCRTPDEAELAALPAHMRQRTICDGVTARYRLDVLRNADTLATLELHGGGLRGDRQLYVFRELPIPSGASEIIVRLARLDSARAAENTAVPDSSRAALSPAGIVDAAPPPGDDSVRTRRRAEMIPPQLELREQFTLAPGEVLLVTYDPDTRRLRAVRDTP